MRLQRVRAMARKEWRHLLRDPRSLALMVLMPTMLLFLFGYAIRLDVVEAPIGVLQEARDGAADDLVATLEASRAFHIVRRFGGRAELRAAVQAGEVWGAVVIPHDYARSLAAHRARVQLILDGVDANTARLVRNYMLALVNDYARGLPGAPDAIRIEDRTWFNEAKESRYAILPGVIAIVMAVIGALITSLTVAREIELGNLVMLRTTPLTRNEFLLGKLTPYFFIGLADLLVAVAAAVWIFDVPLRGSFLALTGVSMLFQSVVMMQGALISLIAANQLLASQMALISTFLPAFLLSGFIFAIQNMPVALQYLTLILPARYYVAVSKAIFLKGVTPLALWTEVLALVAMVVVLAVVLSRKAVRLRLS